MSKNAWNKYILMLEIFMITCCVCQNHFWNKTRPYPSLFHVSTSLRRTSAVVARGDYVAACSTSFRSATEENDSGGHVDGTCPTKVAQPNSTSDWLRILVTSPD